MEETDVNLVAEWCRLGKVAQVLDSKRQVDTLSVKARQHGPDWCSGRTDLLQRDGDFARRFFLSLLLLLVGTFLSFGSRLFGAARRFAFLRSGCLLLWLRTFVLVVAVDARLLVLVL